MARERERFEAVRSCRLKSSAAVVSSVLASTSSSHGVLKAPHKLIQKSVSEVSEPIKTKLPAKQDLASRKVLKSSSYYYHVSLIFKCFLNFTCVPYQSFAPQEGVTLIEERLQAWFLRRKNLFVNIPRQKLN